MKKVCCMAMVALMLLAACGDRNKVKKPSVLLTEQQMIDLLADSYLIEAELNQRKTVGEDVTKLQESYYKQLFEHYHINDTIFEENMTYYSYQLSTLERIMDSVNQRFVNAQATSQ